MNESRLEGTANGNTNGHQPKSPVSGPQQQAAGLAQQWATDPRWRGTHRTYSADDVIRLRGSVQEERTLARLGARRLWALLHEEDYIAALGAVTGNQAVQQVRAGLQAIYLSGWQVAADANLAAETYPDQSLYWLSVPSDSAQVIWSARSRALLIRRTAWGTELTGYRLWSG